MKYIGCSGYYYNDWKGKFYPSDMKKEDFLPFYSEKFNSVEINNTFYNLPEKSTFKAWDEKTPASFGFTLKGSRYITHLKKLKADKALKDAVKNFYNSADILGKKLKCVLWQLPSNLHRNDEKLKEFCGILSENIHNCIEFRDPSWVDDEVFEILDKAGAVFCSLSSPEKELNHVVNGKKLSYFRFHGETKGKWYNYKYSEKELKNWAKAIEDAKSKDVFAYFNNDISANAPENALKLKEILE